MKYKKNIQMSDTLFVGAILACAGGFLDVYTYLLRGKVFANAQTGNMVLLGISMADGNWKGILYYLLPILSFSVGVLIADIIKDSFKENKTLHWRQIILFIEGLMLLFTISIPSSLNWLANSIISLVCALQVETFRKFRENPYATTMCTGNLRSATWHLYSFIKTKEKKSLKNSLQYFVIIGFFIFGALIGSYLCTAFSFSSILFAVLLLFLSTLLMCLGNCNFLHSVL